MWALALALRCRREQRSCFRLAPRAILRCRGGTDAIPVAFGLPQPFTFKDMGAGASFIDVEELTEALEQDFARVVPRTPRGSLDVLQAAAGTHCCFDK